MTFPAAQLGRALIRGKHDPVVVEDQRAFHTANPEKSQTHDIIGGHPPRRAGRLAWL